MKNLRKKSGHGTKCNAFGEKCYSGAKILKAKWRKKCPKILDQKMRPFEYFILYVPA